MKRFKTLWKFSRDERGSVLPFLAVVGVAIIAATGFGIDGARLMLLHSSLQRAIDAGALSTVAKLDAATIDAQLTKFTNANFAGGSVGANIDAMTWTLSSDKKTLTVNATASTPATLLSIVGVQKLSTSVESVIERSSGGLELALVLDNTGSMAGTGLKSLQTSSNTLLDILFGDKTTVENLYVGIVPFSQTVNIGKSHTSWLKSGSAAALDWGPTSWGGCVEAFSTSADDASDATPSSKPLTPYYWEDSTQNDWISINLFGKKTYDSTLNETNGPNKNCPAEVTRLTNDKTKLVASIAAMKAVGNTHVNFGAVWGWRMLSPGWRGLWGGDMDKFQLPLNYNTPHMSKAAVIMTDGENTMSSDIYTAYGWLADKKLGTSNSLTAVTALNTRLTTTCTAMKNAGVTVYTIAFDNPGTSVQNLLRGCASQNAFYFNSPTTADLQAAFKAIGDSLSNLRVSR